MVRPVLLALVLAGCNATLADGPSDGAVAVDGRIRQVDSAPPTDTRTLGAWGPPTQIIGASDPALDEDDATLSSTQTELYFAIANASKDLYVMKRATPQAVWGPKTALPFNTAATEESPRLSPDDLTLYFGRAGDIYVATRPAVGMPWSAATLLASVSTTSYEKWLAVCNGNYFMVSRLNGANGQDLYEGQLGNGAGNLVTRLSSASSEISTFLSADCLTVYFASNRDVSGNIEIYTATRSSITATWSTPTMVTYLGASTDNEDPWVSATNDTFVFSSVRAPGTTKDLYISTR